MKGLTKTSIILAVLIVISIVTSTIITRVLRDRVIVADGQGFEEGHSQGYETGFREGHKAGFQEGSKIGYKKGGEEYDNYDDEFGDGFYFTYNPTYNQMREILAESNKNTAHDVNTYAEDNGIRTAYVRCQIARKTTERKSYFYHLVAFETVDKGFVIIRPRSHEEVKVKVGKSYSELNGFPTPAYDDTITKITIVW